ncbi:hypothetical protein CDL15_Pgr019768 [Punica granatum]|uniref:Uncharacterized protein n=1 Tax=Punica granatum TaxID=22663 RepID=A0A218X6W1_PUNGR|nr:hypothetical protein CDL15_Pgr019768 [Punica granatum]
MMMGNKLFLKLLGCLSSPQAVRSQEKVSDLSERENLVLYLLLISSDEHIYLEVREAQGISSTSSNTNQIVAAAAAASKQASREASCLYSRIHWFPILLLGSSFAWRKEGISFDTKDQLAFFECAFCPDVWDNKEQSSVADTTSTCLNMPNKASLLSLEEDRSWHLPVKSLKDLEISFFDVFLIAKYREALFTTWESSPLLRLKTDYRS